MIRTILNCRTCSCLDLKVIGVNAEGKGTESIMFKVAADRSYQRTIKDEEGNDKKVRESDFILCVAYGAKAKLINKHCNLYDENGRFISRPLYLEGRIETYTKETEVTMSEIVVIDGKKTRVTLSKPIKQYGFKMIVDTINFLSGNPVNAIKKNEETIVKSIEVLEEQGESQSSSQKEVVVNTPNNIPTEYDVTADNNGEVIDADFVNDINS